MEEGMQKECAILIMTLEAEIEEVGIACHSSGLDC
jgi:hypothetical protein